MNTKQPIRPRLAGFFSHLLGKAIGRGEQPANHVRSFFQPWPVGQNSLFTCIMVIALVLGWFASPAGAQTTVYAATSGGLSISRDDGTSFSNITTADGLGSNVVFGVFVSGRTVYAATNFGLSISRNGGTSFINKTTADGLGSNVVFGVFVSGRTIYAATLGGLSISRDGDTSFISKTTTDGLGSRLVHGVFVSGSTVYAATDGGLSISRDGGTSFINKTKAAGLGDNPVRVVFVRGSTVYAATLGGLSISRDGGTGFINKTTADGLGDNEVHGVFISGSTIYAATDGGLSISRDAGTSFSNKTTAGGLGNNFVRRVFVRGSTVYAATSDGLSISRDGGTTFSNKTTADGLGIDFVNSVFVVTKTVVPAPGDLAADPLLLNFGRVNVGANRVKMFTLRNEGLQDLVVTGANFAGSHGNDFEFVGLNFPFTLVPGAGTEVSVRFTPDSLDNRSGRVFFTSNDPDENPFLVKLRGEGKASNDPDEPDITVDPLSVDFGKVVINTESLFTIVVGNDGSMDLEVSSTDLQGEDASDWAVRSGATPFTVAPGNTHKLVLAFKPGLTGAKEAVLELNTNDWDEQIVQVLLSGTGILATLVARERVMLTFGESLKADFQNVTSDAYLDSRKLDYNHGGSRFLRLGHGSRSGRTYRTVISFDFFEGLAGRGVIDPSQIVDAWVELYVFPRSPHPVAQLYRLNRDWEEGETTHDDATAGEVTWRSAQHGTEAWSSSGAGHVNRDREGRATDTQLLKQKGRVRWNVRSPIRQMLRSGENNGWILRVKDESKDNDLRIVSSEHERSSWRPRLWIIANAPLTALSKSQKTTEGSFGLEQPGERASEPALPAGFALQQNYPNPFNPKTRIYYSLPGLVTLSLTIFDITGKEIRKLMDAQEMGAGDFSIIWDGKNNFGTPSASGIYFYRILARSKDGVGQGFVATRRMILLK